MPTRVWGLSLSKATSIFAQHLFIASIDSATSSALVSQSWSSGSTDRKIRPASFSLTLNCQVSFSLRFVSMCSILTGKGGIVLRSVVYYTKGTVCSSLLSMLGTTSPSLWFCGSATCLHVVSTDPGWLSEIGRGCAGRMSQLLGALGAGSAWEF